MTFEEWYAVRTETWHESARLNKKGISAEAWDVSRAATLAEVAKWHEEAAESVAQFASGLVWDDACVGTNRGSAAHFREIGGGA